MHHADSGNLARLDAELIALLSFYAAALDEAGGFHWLNALGEPDFTRPKFLWLNCRFIHSYALAEIAGRPGCTERVAHGLKFLANALSDRAHGGYFQGINSAGGVLAAKETYGHAFVILAAASALQAGHDSKSILSEALDVSERLWEPQHGLYADSADPTWSKVDEYRGINANMHMVEALLAAAEVTSDNRLSHRAGTITTRVLELARENEWRLIEHFDREWNPVFDYNSHNPKNPFRPYGSTVGHWLEWSRLALQARAAGGGDNLLVGAIELFEAAMREGRNEADDGFVFTVGWSGDVVDSDRYHWVTAEAIGASSALAQATGERRYGQLYQKFWDEAVQWFIDRDHGGWVHQLDISGNYVDTVWPGKPDLYHSLQATMFARAPLGPDLAGALRKMMSAQPGD